MKLEAAPRADVGPAWRCVVGASQDDGAVQEVIEGATVLHVPHW